MQGIGEVSDAQLVTSIGRYSEVALAEVYRRHGGAVYGLARRVLNNTTEAEDVTQEVFLRLWNQPDRFDPARRTATADYDMQHAVWDLAMADQVATALGELPDEERRAIELAYYEGHTYV